MYVCSFYTITQKAQSHFLWQQLLLKFKQNSILFATLISLTILVKLSTINLDSG